MARWSTPEAEAENREENRDVLADKAVMLAQDVETFGGLSRDLGPDRVCKLALVYATLACRP